MKSSMKKISKKIGGESEMAIEEMAKMA